MATGKSTARKPRGNYRRVKHGGCRNRTATPEYTSWKGMKRRCYNPNFADWHLYGGKGVAICRRWLHSFSNFLEDMGARPSPEHSIDRIDGNGNYSCGHCDECLANGWTANCRWATPQEQSDNTSTTRLLTYNGETRSISGWARHIGIDDAALCGRLRRGWALAKALTTPPLPPSRGGGAILLTHAGETMTLQEWARRLDIKPATILARIKKLGWSVERALATPTRLCRPKKLYVGEPKMEQPLSRGMARLLTYNGETLSIRGWARSLGVSDSAINYRRKQGWDIGQIVNHYST